MTRTSDIQKAQQELENKFYELLDTIDEFIIEPTIKNRKEVQEKNKEFIKAKNKIIRGINDFWCKGE